MVTVSQYVKKYVQERPFIEQALAEGIINHAALAEKIMPLIESEMRITPKFSAVNMAIRRLSETLTIHKATDGQHKFESDIVVKNNIVDVFLHKSQTIIERIEQLQKDIAKDKNLILNVIFGVHEINLIINEKYVDLVVEYFSPSHIKKIIREIASITVTLSPQTLNDIGIFYVFLKELSWNNIPVIDIISTYTEVTFVVYERDLNRAFSVVSGLVG
jgi:hypothetical protein